MILLVSIGIQVISINAKTDSHGPAPNSGDGVPDGSGYDRTDWPNEETPAKGPAPSSGDSIPDGSGF